jgi:MOSC domain-containing protein YiiM
MRPMNVEAVARDGRHRFSKPTVDEITLLAGLGVEGDTHAGVTVQHRSRVRRDPSQPNLRQVHLVHAELLDTLQARGYRVGLIGENVTTRGLALLDLPIGAVLRLGADAVIELTGLRNPCVQLDKFQTGLMKAMLDRDPDGGLVRLAGVMAIVRSGGVVRPGDPIAVELPPEPHRQLQPV